MIEVKEISERETWIGENIIYLGDDNIVYITAAGIQDEEMAIAPEKATLKLIDMVKGEVKILVDLNKAGKSSPEARKIWRELSEHETTGKVALFGIHPVVRMVASFGIGISKKKDIRFFKTKREALTWLKE